MTSTLAPPADPASPAHSIPPLENGDTLTRAEFERRYAAMPHIKKAELIEGEVYMPSPVSLKKHADPHALVVTWLGFYRMETPGVIHGDNGALRLDNDNEPQPDAFLMILPESGGQARVSKDDYVEGAPELIVEVASSSESIDLNKKLNAYRRSGVLEYVVWRVRDRQIDWFILREGSYGRLSLDGGGLYQSEAFPGLVLDPGALIRGDLKAVSTAVSRAVESEAHSAFVKRLAAARTDS